MICMTTGCMSCRLSENIFFVSGDKGSLAKQSKKRRLNLGLTEKYMMKNIYIIGVLLFMLASCKKDRDIHYLDHSKWFIYEVNDTLVFKDGEVLDVYTISQIINTHEIIDKQEGDEILSVVYEGISECKNCPFITFDRNYQLVRFQGEFPIVRFYYDNTQAINYLLGDTLLDNIYVIDDIPTEDTVFHKVKAIYYSDLYGIIRYDMYDDRVYELQIE